MEDVCIYGEEIGVKVFFAWYQKTLPTFSPFFIALYCLLSDERIEKRVKMPLTTNQAHILISHGKHIRDANQCTKLLLQVDAMNMVKRGKCFFGETLRQSFLMNYKNSATALAEEWKVTAYDEFGYNKWESFVV